MPTTQDDLQNALLDANRNINNFEPSPAPPAPTPSLDQIKEAVARNTAQELAQALFPVVQQIASDMASRAVDTNISNQLSQLQSDINTIKAILGIA